MIIIIITGKRNETNEEREKNEINNETKWNEIYSIPDKNILWFETIIIYRNFSYMMGYLLYCAFHHIYILLYYKNFNCEISNLISLREELYIYDDFISSIKIAAQYI